jgi:RNA polymerase sigma-70 factor, ECF subfamily
VIDTMMLRLIARYPACKLIIVWILAMIQMFGDDQINPPSLETTKHDIIALLPRLRRFCMGLTGSLDAGDDLTQSTVERALRRVSQWQEGTRLDSWMFRIARNINIDEARARIRRTVQFDSEVIDDVMGEDGRDITENRSTLACVRTAMAKLSEDQRALMLLVVVEGKSYREAAEALDIPIGTVMSRIARARRAIDGIVNDAA